MNCSNCGNKLKGNENFCRICGTPVKKEEEFKEEKVELTDNIDVSKIKVASENNISGEDTMDVDITDKNTNKELSAMIEITNKEDDSIELIKPEKKKKGRKAKDKEEIKETDSSKKIKEILAEMKPEVEGEKAKDNVEEVIDEMKEPTAFIPDDLIKDYKKKEENKEQATKEEAVDEVKEEIKDVKNDTIETEPKKEELNDNLLEHSEEKEDSKEEIKEESKAESDVESKTELEEEPIVEPKEEVKEETEDLDKSIISLDEEKTTTLELSKDKTEKFDEPIISFNSSDDDEYTDRKSASGIVFGILFFISLACAGYLFFMYTSSNKKMNDYKDKYNKISNESKNADKGNDISNKQNSTASNIIEYNGYLFNNLDDTKNSIVENKLVFQGAKNTIALYIKNDTKYSTVKYAKDEYKNALENDDYEVSSYGTKVTDQVEYVVYEIKDKEGNYYLVAYTKLTDNDTIAFIISTKDNKIDYDLLSETNKIVKTTKENKNSIQYNIKLFTKED